jgi:hypothetical protein
LPGELLLLGQISFKFSFPSVKTNGILRKNLEQSDQDSKKAEFD